MLTRRVIVAQLYLEGSCDGKHFANFLRFYNFADNRPAERGNSKGCDGEAHAHIQLPFVGGKRYHKVIHNEPNRRPL